MEKLNQAQLEQIDLKREGKITVSKAARFYEEMSKLLVGEALYITTYEWPLKLPPSASIVKEKTKLPHAKYSVRRTQDESAFVVVRVA